MVRLRCDVDRWRHASAGAAPNEMPMSNRLLIMLLRKLPSGGGCSGIRSVLGMAEKKIVVVLVSNTVGSGISTLNFDIGKLLLAD